MKKKIKYQYAWLIESNFNGNGKMCLKKYIKLSKKKRKSSNTSMPGCSGRNVDGAFILNV